MKEKRTKIGSGLIILLLIVDLALLVWIRKSYFAEKNEASYENIPAAAEKSEKEPTQAQQTEQSAQDEEKTEIEEKKEASAQDVLTADTVSQSYETDERPTDDDFAEWYAKDVMWNGVPSDVETITDFSQISGTWKGLIYYDPYNERDNEGIELLNFTVGGTEDDATLTADWYSIYFVAQEEGYSQEEENDSIFTGLWLDGVLEVTGSGNIHLKEFYVRDGKQYAVGTMDCVDGEFACVAMVRP